METGLLQGLTEGLKQGLTTYREETDRKLKRDLEAKKAKQEQEDREERLGLLREQRVSEKARLGLKRDDEGNWVPDQESLAYREEARKQKESEAKGLLDAARLDSEKAGLLKTQAETEKITSEARNPNRGKPPSAEQFKAAGFAKRLEQAEGVFDSLSKSGYDRTSKTEGLLSLNPTSVGKSGNLQQQEQAERNFINAVLRKESGAAISPQEFKSAELQYFPRPGDSPQVVAQKKANRDLVKETLKAEGSSAYGLIPSSKPTVSAEDQEALEWANSNPNDPRAAQIKRRLGQ